MQRRRCMICGYITLESRYSGDPYMCSDCEEMMIGEEARYAYPDNI